MPISMACTKGFGWKVDGGRAGEQGEEGERKKADYLHIFHSSSSFSLQTNYNK